MNRQVVVDEEQTGKWSDTQEYPRIVRHRTQAAVAADRIRNDEREDNADRHEPKGDPAGSRAHEFPPCPRDAERSKRPDEDLLDRITIDEPAGNTVAASAPDHNRRAVYVATSTAEIATVRRLTGARAARAAAISGRTMAVSFDNIAAVNAARPII